MASTLIGGALQTTFAAISFAGAGFLFSKINRTGYTDEMKRHNKALENLAAAKEKFYENEVKNKNRIMRLRQQLSDANADINTTNNALDELGRLKKYSYGNKEFNRKPLLTDFYRASPEMKKYENVTGIFMGTAVGFLADKAITFLW